MSHLVLVTEVPPVDPEAIDDGGSGAEQDPDESRPLLRNEKTTSSKQPGGNKVTSSFSLVPDASLPAQVRIHTADSDL